MTKSQLKQKLQKYDPGKAYAFVSYDHKDEAVVWRDVCALQQKGVNVWIDTKSIDKRKKKNWQADVAEVIEHKNCAVLIFYLSIHSLRSLNCYRELCHVDKTNLDFLLIEAKPLEDLNLRTLLDQLIDSTTEDGSLTKKKQSEQLQALYGFKNFFEIGDYFDKSRNQFCYGGKEAFGDYFKEITDNLPEKLQMQMLNDENIDPELASAAADQINQEILYPNGNRYTGQVKTADQEGKMIPHGIGRMVYPNGYEYFGEWRDGQKNGVGKFLSPENKKTVYYFGEWHDGKKNGMGASLYRDGNMIIEEWKNGDRVSRTSSKE